jgi:hypothetical protein
MNGVGGNIDCVSPILRAFAHWTMSAFALPPPCSVVRPAFNETPSAFSQGSAAVLPLGCENPLELSSTVPIRITWISRKDYRAPGVAHTISHGVMSDKKESAMLDALGKNLQERVSLSESYAIELKSVRFELLSLAEQLEEVSATDVLVGMHGAGMVFSMFMPQSSKVVELFTMDRPISNKHYRNLCRWNKIGYAGVALRGGTPNDLDEEDYSEVAEHVWRAVSAFLPPPAAEHETQHLTKKLTKK